MELGCLLNMLCPNRTGSGSIQFYSDELPLNHAVDAELSMWKEVWEERLKKEWKNLKHQHFQATGTEMRLNNAEITKLRFGAVPSAEYSVYFVGG